MPKDLKRIEVAVTVISHKDKLLTVWNSQWGAFTLPMTKLRHRPFGMIQSVKRAELWSDAALRNVGECLGKTTAIIPKLLLDAGGLAQSDRSGDVNHYHFQAFWFPVGTSQLAPGIVADWLTVDEIVDKQRHPISETARTLAALLQAEAIKRKLPLPHFPPQVATSQQRQSQSSLALIHRGQGADKEWLAQWNGSWQRYFFVGGHQKSGETDSRCLEREINEELGLTPKEDYAYKRHSRSPQKYVDWSTGFWQETQYKIAVFEVSLSESAERRVAENSENRWLKKDEILFERTEDDRPISPTMKTILKKTEEL